MIIHELFPNDLLRKDLLRNDLHDSFEIKMIFFRKFAEITNRLELHTYVEPAINHRFRQELVEQITLFDTMLSAAVLGHRRRFNLC